MAERLELEIDAPEKTWLFVLRAFWPYRSIEIDGHRIVGRAVTHFQLAELVNARRETVGEFLKRLRGAGVIELRRRCIVILDADALERIVRED